jgi:hypothetical protein
MLICKLFSGTDAVRVEDELNTFLQRSPHITIHSICQSCDSHRVFISIFFNVKTQSAIAEAEDVAQVETIVSKAELK